MDGAERKARMRAYDEAMVAARSLVPSCSRLAIKGEPDARFRAMAERVLARARPQRDWPRYCGQVIWFVLTLAKLQGGEGDAPEVRTWLVDLADFCDGIPADAEAVGLLQETYNRQPAVGQVAAAECVGRLDGGLARAEPMFVPLLRDTSNDVRTRTAMAVSRALRAHVRGAKEIALWVESLSREHVEALRVIADFSGELSKLEIPSEVRDLLVAQGALTLVDYLVSAHERDEQFFRHSKREFLRTHKGEFVAIRDQRVIGFATNAKALQRLVDRECGKEARAFVARVVPEAFERRPEVTIYGDGSNGVS